jgi:hypothetical protein
MRVRSLAAATVSAAALTLLGGGIASADTPGQGGPNEYEKQWIAGGAAVGGGAAAMADSLASGAPEMVIIRTGQFFDMLRG